MPLFAREGDRFVGALQCGAGLDAFLKFTLSREPVDEVVMHELPPIEHGLSDGVDPIAIRDAAIEGADFAATRIGVRYYVSEVWYVPNDSRHYRLHARIVYQTIEHLHAGGRFRELDPEL